MDEEPEALLLRMERPRLIDQLISLAMMGWLAWICLPPDEKMWLRLKWQQMGDRLVAVLAAREGRAGMADELAGRDPRARYLTALRLGLLRARVQRP